MAIIACHFCGESFEAKSKLRMYCSSRCKDRGKPSVSGLTCFVCGGWMVRSRTSKVQGLARHNKCSPLSGHDKHCRCDDCKRYDRERAFAYRQKRKAAGNPLPSGRWISDSKRRAIYERDNGVCQLCFNPVDFGAHHMDSSAPTLDHIVPRAHGGTHAVDNLRLACRGCNCARGDRLGWEAVHVSG